MVYYATDQLGAWRWTEAASLFLSRPGGGGGGGGGESRDDSTGSLFSLSLSLCVGEWEETSLVRHVIFPPPPPPPCIPLLLLLLLLLHT